MSSPRADFDQSVSSPDKLMDRLLQFEPTDMPVISIYLDARVDQTGHRSFFPYVKKQLNERCKSYPVHSPERKSFDEDFVRIIRYLEDETQPSAQGLAIFACSAANDYFEVGQFEAPFENNRLFVYDRPHVYPLARLMDQYQRYVVLLADRNRARIFVFASARPVEEEQVENAKTKHIKAGGWSQSRFQRHEENYHLHHAKEVIEKLERIVREEGIEKVILAGDEETAIPILREQMPKMLSEKIIDVLSLGIDTPEHELLGESLKAFRAHDSIDDQQKVEHLLDEFRGDNLGAAGVEETLAALSNGQVEELLITAASDRLVYDEEEVRKVLELYGDAAEVLDKRTIADELVRRANELSAARVTFIEDSKLLEQVGGVGALLRYRIAVENAAPYEESASVSKVRALVEVEAHNPEREGGKNV